MGDDEDFEKKLNKEKSFLNTSKNHTAEFEKQLEGQKEKHRLSDDERKQAIRKRLFSEDDDDILESSDSSSGIGGLIPAFIGILVAVIVGVGVAIPVITDTMSETTNSTSMTELFGSLGGIVNFFPIIIGIVLFIAVAGLITRFRD